MKRFKILWVDDDFLHLRDTFFKLSSIGFDVDTANNPTEAIMILEGRYDEIDIVVVDVVMPHDNIYDKDTTRSFMRTGIVLAQQIKRKYGMVPIFGCSHSEQEQAFFNKYGDGFIDKGLLKKTKAEFDRMVEMFKRSLRRCFIVHGHDKETAKSLEKYLIKDLQFSEVITLSDQPNLGRTIIEKFEDYAMNTKYIFVLLTSDDKVINDNNDKINMRARQNVIFELGYFYAKLQRRSGRIILLYKDSVEIPSDISGIAYIDITKGIKNSSKKINAELKSILPKKGSVNSFVLSP